MSRLNDSIKCVVMLNNFTLAFLALIVVIVAALVFTGQWDDFDSETFETTCMWAFAIGGSLLVITIIGCMGAVNQIEREGTCTGRKILGIYQILIISLLVLCIILGIEGEMTIDSIEYTLSEPAGGTEYDKFERIIAPKFNGNYFSGLCQDFPANSWFLEWVGENCPVTMTLASCAYTPTSLKDSVCNDDASSCTAVGTFDPMACCPDDGMCTAAYDNFIENEIFNVPDLTACPYQQCRMQTLAYVVDTMEPVLTYLQFVVYALIAVVFLTCLLICYNPRDNLSEELIKTGVIVAKPIVKNTMHSSNENRRASHASHASSGRRHKQHRRMTQQRG